MRNESQPNLHPEAHVALADFSPELQTEASERLARLSHTALLDNREFGDRQLEPDKLGEEHQPHLDAVSLRMEQASTLLSSAANELDDGKNASFDELAVKAQELAVTSAHEAKQAGDEAAAISAVESFLLIDALKTPAPIYDDIPAVRATGRELVAQGLGDELAQASHRTFGLIAIHKHDARPLSIIAEGSSDLLRAATSLEFNDNFSQLREGDTPQNGYNNLDTGDLLALSRLKTIEDPSGGESRKIITYSLEQAGRKDSDTDIEALADTLLTARQLSLDTEIKFAGSDLRTRRQVGNPRYRGNDINTSKLDMVVVNLARAGDMESAASLISSSPHEIENLTRTLERSMGPGDETAALLTTLKAVQADKEASLRDSLQQHGASANAIERVMREASDPDSAGLIMPETWRQLTDHPEQFEMLLKTADLAERAEALSAIGKAGLSEYSSQLLAGTGEAMELGKAEIYLASFKEAVDSLKRDQTAQGQNVNVRTTIDTLAKFEDPMAALEAGKKYLGADTYPLEMQSIYSLLSANEYGFQLTVFRPEDVDSLVIMKHFCDQTGMDISYMLPFVRRLKAAEHPIDLAGEVAAALKTAGVTSPEEGRLFSTIAAHEKPSDLAEGIALIKDTFGGEESLQLRQTLLKYLFDNPEPKKRAELFLTTQEALQAHQLDLASLGESNLHTAFYIYDNEGDKREFGNFCSNIKIRRECEDGYRTYFAPLLRGEGLGSINRDNIPRLSELPELRARFDRLGVDPELADQLYDSWSSYSALSRKLYTNEGLREAVTTADITSSLKEQGEDLVRQIAALDDYIAEHGVEEATAIAETFGIHHFRRYHQDQLHGQMVDWNRGETPAQNILISARADWNGAIDDAGKSFDRVLGREGFICFEVSDKVELAKAVVAVGNRERSMGRNPEAENSVKNLVIDAHANPYGLHLGTKRQLLSTEDYVREPMDGARSNTYRRHLGSQYRVILKACSTAGEVAYGKNIAESISTGHVVQVDGSRVNTKGSIIINPDGTVVFNSGSELSIVYS